MNLNSSQCHFSRAAYDSSSASLNCKIQGDIADVAGKTIAPQISFKFLSPFSIKLLITTNDIHKSY